MALRNEITVARSAMACDFSVTFPASERRAVEIGCAALDEIERMEESLSAYRDSSELSRVNRCAAEAPVEVSGEFFALMQTSARLAAETGGAFDPAFGALVKAWGFFRPPRRVPSEGERRRALETGGMARVKLDAARRRVRYLREGLEINFGAVGKGYALDRAAAAIGEEFGARPALLGGGQSSLRATGAPAPEPRGWRVAIGDPLRPERALAVVWLRDRALGTSADSHQYFFEGGRRWGHILDPRTGWPAGELLSATAIAATAAEADALSTAFFVLGVEGTRNYCRAHRGVAAILLTRPAPERPARLIVIGPADVEKLS